MFLSPTELTAPGGISSMWFPRVCNTVPTTCCHLRVKANGMWLLLVPEPPLIEISATRCYKHLFNSCSPWLFLSGGQRTAKVSESFQWKPLQVAQNTAWHADGWGITPSWLVQGHLKQNLLPLTFLKIEEGFLEDIPWNTVQQGLLYSIVFVF